MSSEAATTPAGWYPSEGGQRRYWDGQAWTDQVQPAAPTSNGSGMSVTYAPAKTNHVLHLILSLVTLGAWAPFWLTIAVVNSGKFVPQQTFSQHS